jgi:hypothetical protein
MVLAPEELEGFCAALAQRAMDGMRQALAQAHAAARALAPPDQVWVTHEAARLPGLVDALAQHLPDATAIHSLPADAVGKAAHALAGLWLRGELPRGHLDASVARLGAAPAFGRDLLDPAAVKVTLPRVRP